MVGADVVASLDTWHDHEALRELVTLAVVDRPGRADGRNHRRGGARSGWPVAPVDVSSTALRSALESGEPVDGLVPDAVIRCIVERDLYAKGR